jgi:DNA repair protein RecN (Recombination protein N)
MLTELRVENLLLIERAELRLAPGLNVLTGETGAGKTVLAHALDLLLGGRSRSGIVRPGASEAYVEGVFELTDELRDRLGDRLPADADELVLARRVSPEGRTRAYLAGRSASVGDLRDVAGELITFYGQHEHRKLTLAAAQLEVFDGFCGAKHLAARAEHASLHSRVRDLSARREELAALAGAREREMDLLEFELAEIDGAAPSEDEQAALAAERERLRHGEALRAAAYGGAEAISPESGGPGAAMLLAQAGQALDAVAGADPELGGLAERLRSVSYEIEDLGGEFRRYEEAVDATPGRLEEVEERLATLDRLARKHGGTIAGVLAHAERCRERRAELAGAEVAIGETDRELAEARAASDALAAKLTAARRKAAPKLSAAVAERLDELAMSGARFEVLLEPRGERASSGDEQVDFLLAANPGVPAGPVREIASGGELSRVMLALMGVAADAGATAGDAGPLLVFDEIDAGIGGHTARAVGERLRDLAADGQVLCITHLPQVASLGAAHFRVAKDAGDTTARTTVGRLEGDQVVGELVRMLGADADDLGARRHAKSLLKAAA